MPTKTPRSTALEWTRLYKNGMSISEIRIHEGEKNDPRTIERVINAILAEETKRNIQEAVLRDRYDGHCSALLEAVGTLYAGVVEPQDLLDFRPVFALDREMLRIKGGTAESSGEEWIVTLRAAGTVRMGLLKEHMDTDPVWKLFDDYVSRAGEYVAARMCFARQLCDRLEQSAALHVADERMGEEHVSREGVSSLEEVCVLGGQEGPDRVDDLLKSLKPGPDESGLVMRGRLLISGEGPVSGDVTEHLRHMGAGISEWPEWKRILSARVSMQVTGDALREDLEVLQIANYLPGDCRACSRYWG